MAKISTDRLHELVTDLARRSSVGTALQRVEIENQDDEEPEATVRIVIRLKNLKKANLVELQQLLSAVEDSLSGQDDRYPSVRFAEAA
jgi:hypothetical protein